ncbi:MAG: hypothetical protein GTO16_09730 [Candidatus Aminicenantes bacterium]|nr:hypothetical protein [Candidatus Aminicenantes bacterium]
MRIFTLYQDFCTFLEKISPDSSKWEIYFTLYFKRHQEFLENYFSHFPLIDFSNLKERVERIRASDYSLQKHLISVCPPEKIINESYLKCRSIVSSKEEPEVYLFFGFFSPDAFVMDFRGKPVICFGLERFRDFRLLKILFAHEYAHFLLNLSGGEIPEDKKLKWLLISEGIATYFSSLAFTESKISDHLLMIRDRLNWCQENEDYLRDIYSSGRYSSEELIDFYRKGNQELDIPPRAGKYLGFQAVRKYLEQREEKNIKSLFSDKKLPLSLEL